MIDAGVSRESHSLVRIDDAVSEVGTGVVSRVGVRAISRVILRRVSIVTRQAEEDKVDENKAQWGQIDQ